MLGKAYGQAGVGLGVWEFSGIREAILEMGCYNMPPCLRNRLFSK